MKVIVYFWGLVFLLITTFGAVAIDIDGRIEQNIEYINNLEKIQGVTKLNLELKKEFGFDKYFYINCIIDCNYNHDSFCDFEIKEGYFDFYLSSSDVRIGKQLVNWGTAYRFNPSDVINPIDYTAENPLEAQIGVNSLHIKHYTANNVEVSGIISEFVPEKIPENLKEKYIYEVLSNFPAGSAVVEEIKEPELNNISDLEYALKLTRRNIYGFDLSGAYFKGYEDQIGLVTDLETAARVIRTKGLAKIKFRYKKTHALSFNVIGLLDEIGIWLESNYSFNENEEKTTDFVIGGDYTFSNNLYTVVQYYHRHYVDFQMESSKMNYLFIHMDVPFMNIHEFQTNIMYDVNNTEYFINPEINYSLGNNINLELGTVISSGYKDLSDFSMMKLLSYERSYLSFNYYF